VWSEGSSVVSGSALVVRFCRVWSVCVLALLSVGSTAPLERVTRGSFVDCSNSLSYLFLAFERKWGEEGYVVSLPVGGKGRPMRPERTLAWGMQASHRMMPPSLDRRGRSGATPPSACFTDRDRTAPGRLPGILAKSSGQAPLRHLHGDRIAGVVREEPEPPASPVRTVSDREKGRGNTLSRDTLSPSWAPRSSSLRRHQHFVSTRRAHGSS
jgi:hypothetical protein